jgi:hypothetical protein
MVLLFWLSMSYVYTHLPGESRGPGKEHTAQTSTLLDRQNRLASGIPPDGGRDNNPHRNIYILFLLV